MFRWTRFYAAKMKPPLKSYVLLLILIAVLGRGAGAKPANAQNAHDPRFGVIEAFWAPNEAAALGVGWERILFYWNQLQPFGPEDWNSMHVPDEWLAMAAAQGRTVVGLLKNTPTWASDSGLAASVPRGLYLPVDDPGNLWAEYTRRVSSFYGPRGVHHWVIWNEPDIAPDVYGHEFGGTIADYYQLLKVAYQVIKQTDPTATIHLGGLTYWHDPGYLRRFLRAVAADPEAAANNYFFDVITLHIYFRPETVSLIVGNAFAAQREIGIDPLKPVWINETNARPSMDPQWPVQVQAFEVDLEQQAWYIVQAYALGFYAGASRIAVYKLVDINISAGDESWGLVRPDDFSKRPAFFAYQNTIKYLNGFTYPLQAQQAESYTIVAFRRPQGLTRVLWARHPSPVTLQVPALAPTALLVDPITDERFPITAVDGTYSIELSAARCHAECLMGGPPLFLVEEGVTVEEIPTTVPPLPPTATLAPTTAATWTPTATLTPTVAPTWTPTIAASPTMTPTDTPPPTATATRTRAPAETETPVPTTTATQEPAVTATAPAQPDPSTPARALSAAPASATTEVAVAISGTAVPSPGAIATTFGADRAAANPVVVMLLLGLAAVVIALLFLLRRARIKS